MDIISTFSWFRRQQYFAGQLPPLKATSCPRGECRCGWKRGAACAAHRGEHDSHRARRQKHRLHNCALISGAHV